jgi:hypothetical protein
MASRHYEVSQQGVGWDITLLSNRLSSHPTQAIAVKAAIDAAHKDGGCGHNAQVTVRGGDGVLRTVWVYGRDSYSAAD